MIREFIGQISILLTLKSKNVTLLWLEGVITYASLFIVGKTSIESVAPDFPWNLLYGYMLLMMAKYKNAARCTAGSLKW